MADSCQWQARALSDSRVVEICKANIQLRRKLESMRACAGAGITKEAEGLEMWIRLAKDAERYKQTNGFFSRRFGGGLCYLVLAAEWISENTGRPCYRELTTLLALVAPKNSLSEAALIYRINRFRTRQAEFMKNYMQGRKVNAAIKNLMEIPLPYLSTPHTTKSRPYRIVRV